jgi:DnaJ-class molecular chaperone
MIFSPENPCSICGGTVGSGSTEHAAHWLCYGRQRRSLPTPSLGQQCPDCNGRGSRSKVRYGVPMFLDGHTPRDFERSVNAIWPPCETCGGHGHIEDTPNRTSS